MKINPQIINKGDKAEFVVLPIGEYNKILTLLNEHKEIQEIENRLSDSQERFPLEVVERLSNGDNPITVYREYRGLTQAALATKVNVSKQYISQIEKLERVGTARILKAIAKILKVDLEDLMRNL
mgnify:CR=1 FL=1